MKLHLFTAGVFAALACSAAAADMDAPLLGALPEMPYAEETSLASAVTGNIEASFSKGQSKLFDADNKTWGLRGSMNVAAGGGFNIQGDLDFARSDIEDFDLNRFGGAAHLYYRPGDYALGAFGQLTRYSTGFFDDLGFTGIDDSATDNMAGLEGAWFNDSATFYAQGGYGKADWAGDDADHLMGRIGLRYFLTDNIRLDAEGTLRRLSAYNTDIDVRSFKTVANYRPEGMPVSMFAGYRFDEWEPQVSGTSIGTERNHAFLAGLRYHFGSNSLKDEEKNGPIWSTTAALP